MDLKVSRESRKKTSKCPSNFLCLTDKEKPMCSEAKPICSVEIPLESMLFVKNGDNNCVYMEEYGEGRLCTCPVRFEIYNRYKI